MGSEQREEQSDRNAVRQDSAPAESISSVEDFTIITTGTKKLSKRGKAIDEEEPLIDTTAVIPLRSKKTERDKKKLQRKQAKASQKPISIPILNLPPELVHEIIACLAPSDVFSLLRVSSSIRAFIQENERAVARDIVRRRYWVLAQCFFLPKSLQEIDSAAYPALRSEKYQEILQLGRRPYEHIQMIDPQKLCTCMNCNLAWNHLCLVLDLAHWQKNLDDREPLPMIPRGTAPEWNRPFLEAHAAVVEKAMTSPLTHARILEKHLATTVGTILRTVRRKYTVHPRRLYHLTSLDADVETDEFLERDGPPNHEFPWRRDSYHYLEAYVPNRTWPKEKDGWIYYAKNLHENDLRLVMTHFGPGASLPPKGNSAKKPPQEPIPLVADGVGEKRL